MNPWLIFVVTLVSGAAYLGIELRCEGVSDCPATLWQAVQDQQTLLGLGVALLCAGAAIWVVHWQWNEDLQAAQAARQAKMTRKLRVQVPENILKLNPWLIFALTLVAGGISLGIDLRCEGVSDCPAALQQTLQDGMTLLGLGVALLCAAGAVWVVHWHSNEGLRAARASRARLSRALRAEMPEHLRRLESYAKECIGICSSVIEEAKAERQREEKPPLPFARQPLRCPSLDARSLGRLSQPAGDIESGLARAIAELLDCYEAQHGRMEDLVRICNEPNTVGVPVLEEHHAEIPLRATIELYLRSTRAFPFAETQTAPVEPLEMDYATVDLALIQLGVAERLTAYGRERLLARFGLQAECRRSLIAPSTSRKRNPAAIIWFFTR